MDEIGVTEGLSEDEVGCNNPYPWYNIKPLRLTEGFFGRE